jgi:hypothetical protein
VEQYPKPLTVTEISRQVGFSRLTVAKHLAKLRIEKKAMKALVLGGKKQILWVAWIPPDPNSFPQGYCMLPAWEIEKLELKEDVDIFLNSYY